MEIEEIRQVIREELDRFDKRQSQLFTIDEAAERLKVSRGTIYNMMEAGTLSYTKVRERVRFKEMDLREAESPPGSPVTRHVALRTSVGGRGLLNQAA